MPALPQLEFRLGEYEARVASRLTQWGADRVTERLVERDPTVWFADPVPELENRLGWLDLPMISEETLGDWVDFAETELSLGVRRVVVLGMGGSSLAPEVFQQTFGLRDEFLVVLDSVHPDEIAAIDDRLDLEHTLFVVSSKSGTTIETRSLFEYFWRRVQSTVADPGRRFVVVTDPGSALEASAEERQLHRVFAAPSDVGGRYSALTAFGLVPGALAGTDVRSLVGKARAVAEALESGGRRGREVSRLGAALGELALAGRDKLTLWTTPAVGSFPSWLEQLVAESTGKEGVGILPVVGEERLPIEEYGDDRFFVALSVRGDEEERAIASQLERLAEQGHPVAAIRLEETLDIGAEILRWQVAVGLAGSILGINPFSQPDVQLAKRLARAAMEGDESVRGALTGMPCASLDGAANDLLADWLLGAERAPYLSVQAYMPRRASAQQRLRRLQGALRDHGRRATTVGFGPRFLHSTGQLHKGGASGAHFLQLMVPWRRDLDIPGERLTFGELGRAQADGDAAALIERGQRVLRLELTDEAELDKVADMVEDAR